MDDSELIRRVKDAAAACADPQQVEAMVGEPAWINTLRANDRFAARTADIGPDDPSHPLPPLDQAREVVYWGRPVPGKNPRIVGIVWQPDGSCEVFFGVVYPP